MKPTALTTVQTTGSFGDDTTKVKMGVDENNIEHLLMLLTDLYSDQPLAVVREYSTNARDSHKEAGVTRPIEVTLPNTMSPFFKVRDYGTGLSADEVVNVYSKYGSSTKRESNDFNGMLGLGCKSALTYTNQFTVVSIKNGEKITVVVSRAGNSATMEIVDHIFGVHESNGVEISVPVKGQDAHLFTQKANFLFSFWEPGTVLVNGVTPRSIDLKLVTKNIGTTTGIGHDVVVMGGVPYPVEQRLYDGRSRWGNSFDLVAFVEIGEVAFTPSREALMYTKATEATIARLKAEFAAQIRQTIVDDINAQPTHAKAYRAAMEWKEKFGPIMPSPVTYNGTVIPDVLTFNYAKWDANAYRHAFGTGYQKIGLDKVVQAVVIYDWPGLSSLTPVHKAKIKQWKAQNNITGSYHVFTVAKEGAPWVSDDRIVSWDIIKKIVLPRADGGAPGTPKKKPSIDVFDVTTGYSSPQPIDDTKIQVYVSPTARLGRMDALALYKAFPNIQIVELGENRWDKFKRENPKAMPLRAFVQTEAQAARDALSALDLKTLGMSDWEKRKVRDLDENLVNDPTLKEAIRIAKGGTTSPTLSRYYEVNNLAIRRNIYLPDVPSVTYNLEDKYPLLPSHPSGTLIQKHTYIYLNAAFAANV